MRISNGARRGLWAAAAWMWISACGGSGGTQQSGAPDADASADQGGADPGAGGGSAAMTPENPVPTGADPTGSAGTNGDPEPQPGSDADPGSATCEGPDCDRVNECADATLNDCGDANCLDTSDGYKCTCDGGASFDAGACVCDLTGTFAVRSIADLSWMESLFGADVVIAAGSAESTGFGLLTITRDGGVLRATSRSCGSEAPDLCSPHFSEAYGQTFPESIWDATTMPTQTVDLMLDGDEAPGGTFATPSSAAFLGLRFAAGVDPLGAFPISAIDPSLVWMDDDGDGMPGVTSVMTDPGGSSDRCGFAYAYVPLDAGLGRGKALQVGARTVSHITGTIEDCDTLEGELFTDSVNGRVYGCTRADDLPCDPAQAGFLDSQAKGQSIGKTTFTMVRLPGANATCEDARTATFPD